MQTPVNKATVLIVTLIFFSSISFAQKKEEKIADGNNIIKVNLPALALKNISLQYERAIARKMTVAATFRYMPTGSIPLKKSFIKFADDPDVERQLNNLNVGNYAFMPELRFYLGKKGAFNGFYLGPFASIAKYTTDLVFEYDDNAVTKTIPMDGSVSTFTGGLMIGAQFKLSNKIYLDWWILGPNFGKSKGDLRGQKTLDAGEQQSLRDELDALDIPLTDFTYVVNSNGATIQFDGPWAGLRSGLCIGFRF